MLTDTKLQTAEGNNILLTSNILCKPSLVSDVTELSFADDSVLSSAVVLSTGLLAVVSTSIVSSASEFNISATMKMIWITTKDIDYNK